MSTPKIWWPSKPNNPVLEVRHLSLRWAGRAIHDDVSISFGPGVTVLLGPNGVGKTTFLEGLLDASSLRQGAILLDGESALDEQSIRNYYARVGFMPQRWSFFAGFTVLETVEYAAWLKGYRSDRLRAASLEALEWVGLADEARSKVRKLSGGMQQRVGLAEAFVNNPRLVLLDEPTVGLDPAQRVSFRRFVLEKSGDRAIVLSTHLTDDVEATAKRVIVMSSGGIAFDGAPAELAARGRETRGIGSALEAGYLAVSGEAER